MLDKQYLVDRAKSAAPYEACGFIMEDGSIIEIKNISLAPLKAFKMCTRDATEKLSGTLDFVAGVWHTHPKGTIHPSAEDLEGIKRGAVQPNWDYYIVTANDVHLYLPANYAPRDHSHWSRFGI
jgi:proteasome lid subunit RPN8/RPN11